MFVPSSHKAAEVVKQCMICKSLQIAGMGSSDQKIPPHNKLDVREKDASLAFLSSRHCWTIVSIILIIGYVDWANEN